MPVMNTNPGVLSDPKLGKISLFHLSLEAATSSMERTAQAKIAVRTSSAMFQSAFLRSEDIIDGIAITPKWVAGCSLLHLATSNVA